MGASAAAGGRDRTSPRVATCGLFETQSRIRTGSTSRGAGATSTLPGVATTGDTTTGADTNAAVLSGEVPPIGPDLSARDMTFFASPFGTSVICLSDRPTGQR